MKIQRRFTKQGQNIFDTVTWTTRSSKISNLDGSTVFEMNDAQIPASWSQLATDIMVSKYFRKAGVPQLDEQGNVQKDENGKVVTGPEHSAKQVIHRLAGCWRYWGEKCGYFHTTQDAQSFYDEIAHMLLNQMCAPNSPQWFNTGLNWAYGINSQAQGHWYTDAQTAETKLAEDAYTHPQPHACFIQSIDDDLVNPGGIMDLWVREARLFKYGSGTGTNFSQLRGENEPLSGGGKSSGLMSWLKIGDRAAGAIKSGGTTRRAAKMVCLDLDHPDIEKFVSWKVREELKVAALVEGAKHLDDEQKQAAKELDLELSYDFNGEAYQTVSGQNSNNSVRIPNEFFHCLDEDGQWPLRWRTDGTQHSSIDAHKLWDKVTYAAWRCADPGVQYDSTINQWHTCPNAGRINASNPCSEYMFLDNTACNLASFNLLKFYDAGTRHFDIDGFEHATRLWTIVLEISIAMAAFPSKEIARLSHEYRTIGLGYANIGAMLMQAGIPYDTQEARALCGSITAILTGQSYATSAEMAAELGPFAGYYSNRESMLRVIRNHRRAAYGVPRDAALEKKQHLDLGDYEGLEKKPVPIDETCLQSPDQKQYGSLANSNDLLTHARDAWDKALSNGEKFGYRNAQTTVIAPTGTIGLLMDCDTTGVEPDFALVKFKKLAGGGYFKIANQSLRPALVSLGYSHAEVKDIMIYVMGTLSLDVALPESEGLTFSAFLKNKGFTQQALKAMTDSLESVFELSSAFNTFTVGQKQIDKLGLTEQAKNPSFNLLKILGLSKTQIASLNAIICGTQTVEGAPHLKEAHLAAFDCANTCGNTGKRFIKPEGHIYMMAAAQPFISGAISKTINLPNNATIDGIKEAYRLSWELGLKANALYRDGCKLSQPLNTKIDADQEEDDQENVQAGLDEVASQVAEVATQVAQEPLSKPIERIVERIVHRPMRRRLPDTRRSITHKFNVAGHEGYITVGLYEDTTPGELFITMAKEGSTIGGLMDSLGTSISIALQYGVPIDSLVNKFTHQRFEPAGMTHNRDIPFAKSLVDYIFRWMGMEFIEGYREANAPQRKTKPAVTKPVVKANIEMPASRIAANKKMVSNEASKDTQATVGQNRFSNVQNNNDQTMMSAGKPEIKVETTSSPASDGLVNATMASQMTQMQADAPACDICGTITVRSGTCYKCLNCGNSLGCS